MSGYAIKESRYEALSWLLGKGADPAIVCEASTGRTGLHLAAAYGTLRTVDMIMAKIKVRTAPEGRPRGSVRCGVLTLLLCVYVACAVGGGQGQPGLHAARLLHPLAQRRRHRPAAQEGRARQAGAAGEGAGRQAAAASVEGAWLQI